DSIHNYNDTLILLPMTLLEFNVRQVDNNCCVNWQAVLEEYSKPFQIERSTDGKNYTEIGSTLSRGKQIGLQQFTFTDYGAVNLGAKVIFYRLRQLNAEGKSEYTHTLAITVNYKGSFANIFPNPAVDHARLEVHARQEEKLDWNLTDQFGRTLKVGQPKLSAGATLINIDLKGLPPGIYYVQLKSASVSSQLKLLKL
ncbi:MAG: T9SS type A sorting domain-containing protein, partial [Bacteroidota bacterium]